MPIQDFVNDDNFFRHYGNDRQFYVDALDKLPYLKKIDIGTEELTVYENEGYKPYFTTASQVHEYDSLLNLDEKFTFTQSQLNTDPVFTQSSQDSDYPASHVFKLFETIQPGVIVDGKINQQQILISDSSTVYVNTGRQNLFAQVAGNHISINKALEKVLELDGTALPAVPITPIEIYSADLNVGQNSYLQIGERIRPLVATETPNDLGVQTKPIKHLQTTASNLIENPSFEEGLWSETVGDCNAYDDKGVLDMKLSDEHSEGFSSLQLEAANHVACTSRGLFAVEAGSTYLLSLDYQSPNARQAGFYMGFDNPDNTAMSQRIPVNSSDWQSFRKLITVPEGALNTSLTLYSYAIDGKTNVITRYDNVSLQKIETVATIDPQYRPQYYPVNISQKGPQIFTLNVPGADYTNLVRNPSLDSGLWSDKVGDCNAYDQNGILGMQLYTDAKGAKSVQLEATRHIACTGPGLMPVEEGRQYVFTFDYQSPNGKQAGYYLGFNDEKGSVISEKVPITDKNWHTLNKTITIPAGASTVSLSIYSYALDDKTNVLTRYDNFNLIELPDLLDRFYLVSEPIEKLVAPTDITFDLVNPTLKTVTVKGATTPFYLNMSEAFHPQWQLQFENSKNTGFWNSWLPFAKPDRINDSAHYKLDNFLNGWYVDVADLCGRQQKCTQNSDGSYDLVMRAEFFPQRWFYLGLLISGATLLGCLGYLGWVLVRRLSTRLPRRSAPRNDKPRLLRLHRKSPDFSVDLEKKKHNP